MKTDVSNWSRALWTGLGLMLVGPFFAALGVVVAMLLGPPLGLGPLLPGDLPDPGFAGLFTFVWSAVPAGLAALVIVPVVGVTGSVGALVAAAAGVAGFFIATLFTDFAYRDFMPAMAFLAALVALGVRYALMAGGVLKDAA